MSKKYSDADKIKYYKGLLSKQAGIVQVVKKPAVSKRQKPKKKATSSRSRNTNSKYAPYARLAGGAIGGAIAGPMGAFVGQGLGGIAADTFKAITGIGDYKVVHNSLVNPSDSVPMFRNGRRATIVEHREYIQDVTTSGTTGAFNIESFNINPGNAACFPWLAEIAENYEQYRVHGMVFQFKSQSADALNSVNTALGTVVMATQYNMLNPVFTNKQEMENYEFGCSSRPSCDLLHPIECDPKQTAVDGLFSVRLGGDASNGDPRLYDIGRFSIATVGMQGSNVNIGELWCTYVIELLKPRLGSAADLYDRWTITDTPIDTSDYFGSDPTLAVQSPNSDFNVVLGFDTITIPPTYTGNFVVNYVVFGSGNTGCQNPALNGSNGVTGLTLINSIYNQVQSAYVNATSSISATAYFSCVGGGIVTLSGGVLPLSPTYAEVFVYSIPNNAD